MRRSTIAFALLIFAVAAVLRLLVVLNTTDDPMLDIDQSEYLALAQNIEDHGVLSYGRFYRWGDPGKLDAPGPYRPTAVRAPLYPAVLALFSMIGADEVVEMRVVQALLGAGVAALVFLTALPLFGLRPAVVAGFAMALAPASLFLSAAIFSENLFIFLMTLSVWLWGRGQGVLAGMALGAATLTRAVVLPFIAILAVLALVWRFNRALHFKIVLCAVLVIAPWTIRNIETFHRFVPVATLGWGANLFLGTVDTAYGKDTVWSAVNRDPTYLAIKEAPIYAREAEKRMFDAAVERIAADPLHWLGVRLRQYPRLFFESPNMIYPLTPLNSSIERALYLLGTVAFLGLAAFGTVLALRRWRETYHVMAFPLFILAAHIPVLTLERYGLPMVPMLIVLAAFAFSSRRDAYRA
ncbi:MAG: glycosyltransferase family 39 protein [Proteobacteria bacterium]|nr:glycosyltransferase family 39 protein [Pseudomonadota bacterium]MBS0548612.1 glycosyltransferase family 39 protein [Pseudomonadota bacterium]